MRQFSVLFVVLATMSTAYSIDIEMVFVEGGSFLMGSEKEKETLARPQHKVTLSGFFISKYEVTQELYKQVVGKNPSKKQADDHPVEWVTWFDTIKFCNKLSELEGLSPAYAFDETKLEVKLNPASNGYRLPTEAQWEFAARGGTKSKSFMYVGSNTLDEVAWYKENSQGEHHQVGQKLPNELGLFDMAGNILEWTYDFFGPFTAEPAIDPIASTPSRGRVTRGGGFSYPSESNLPETRFLDYAHWKGDYVGFRLVLPKK